MPKTNESWTEEQWNEWGIFFNLDSEIERANLIRIKLIAEKDKEREEAYTKGRSDEAKTCKGCQGRCEKELQKAREEERFRLQKEILSCVTAEGDDCFFLRVAKDSPIFTQSELDQPTKLSNCIECGYPVPEYEEVSNCHSTCRLEV